MSILPAQLTINFSARPATARLPEKPRKPTVSDKIMRILEAGGAWTYSELQAKIGGVETTIAARLREFKQDGVVEKRLRSRNLWEWYAAAVKS